MKRFLSLFLTLLVICFTGESFAQGLQGLGKSGSDITESSPLRVSVGAELGYDSNTNTSSKDEIDSLFTGGGIGVFYALATETTRFDIGGNFSGLYYENTAPSQDDFYWNTRVTANLGHKISQRTTLTNNALIAYEVEPDYVIGASSALRNDHYIFGYDRLALNHQWTRRFSTITSYTFNGVWYDDNSLSRQEDRHTHTFGQQLRYALSRKTTANVEYRFAYTDFLHIANDTNSHYLLGGADHEFSSYTSGGIAVGAEYRDFERYGAITRPYGEAYVLYKLTEDTSVRWAGRAGLENNEIGNYRDRYGYRTGLTAIHGFTPSVRGSLGISYLHSEFDAVNGDNDLEDASDDAVSVNVGVTYRLFRNVDVNAGYQFTTYFSDIEDRDYERHRATVGVSSVF
jgi:opacity protein-like surface antigen